MPAQAAGHEPRRNRTSRAACTAGNAGESSAIQRGFADQFGAAQTEFASGGAAPALDGLRSNGRYPLDELDLVFALAVPNNEPPDCRARRAVEAAG